MQFGLILTNQHPPGTDQAAQEFEPLVILGSQW